MDRNFRVQMYIHIFCKQFQKGGGAFFFFGTQTYTWTYLLTWKKCWEFKKFFWNLVSRFLYVSMSMYAKGNGKGMFLSIKYNFFLATFNCFVNLGFSLIVWLFHNIGYHHFPLGVCCDCEKFYCKQKKRKNNVFCADIEINYIIYIFIAF